MGARRQRQECRRSLGKRWLEFTGEKVVGKLKDSDLEQANNLILSRSSPMCGRVPCESYLI